MVVGLFRNYRHASHETKGGDEVGEGKFAADGGSFAAYGPAGQASQSGSHLRLGQFFYHAPRLHLAKSLRAAYAWGDAKGIVSQVGANDTEIKGEAALLCADRLAVVRGGRMLLSGVDLTLRAGDAVVLAGPNGVGKSSLLRVLAGLIPAFAGALTVNAPLALSDESPALDVDLPLAKALQFWAALDGPDAKMRVAKALADLNITHLAEVPVRILSTGQRRRAGLARVVASGAPIWLLDEPGNGLDRESLRALGHVIAEHRAAGGAVVIATHFDLPVEDARVMPLQPAPVFDEELTP